MTGEEHFILSGSSSEPLDFVGDAWELKWLPHHAPTLWINIYWKLDGTIAMKEEERESSCFS